MKRALCIWLPQWPLQRLAAARGGLSARPVLLYQLHATRGARVVAYCPHLASAAAGLWNRDPRERAGIRVDMPLAEATALASYARGGAPHLELHDPAADRAALENLAEWCQQFSPSVGLEEGERPAGLLLDITGLGRLCGGDEALARGVVRAFAERRLTARVAVADTLAAAWAVAHFAELDVFRVPLLACPAVQSRHKHWRTSRQWHPELIVDRGFETASHRDDATPLDRTDTARSATAAVLAALAEPVVVAPGETWAALAGLNVAALRLPEETCTLLAEVGLRRIDELAAVPRAMLLSRFGPEVLGRLDQATGAAAEAIVAQAPPAECEFQWLFDFPTERRETIDAALEHLIGRACEGLAGQRRGVLRLRCRFETEAHTARECVVGLFRPSADVRHLGELARLKLEGVRFDRPLAAIRLTVLAADRLRYEQQEIFIDPDASRAAPRAVAALVDRLSNRLGAQAVLRPWLLAGAQPEFACQYRPVASLSGREKSKKPKGRGPNTQARSASEGSEHAHARVSMAPGALQHWQDASGTPNTQARSASEGSEHAHASVSMAPGARVSSAGQGPGRTKAPSKQQRLQAVRAAQSLAQKVPGDRPLYLHPQPLRLPVLSIAPEGPPARFRLAGHDYHIVRVWGPERIETGWWRTRCVRRDYYQVETRDGQRFWLFRELGAGAWFLHGEFA